MIELSNYQKTLINLLKDRLDGYEYKKSWIKTIEPLFFETYGWDPFEHQKDYLECLFNNLLEIHKKISENYDHEIKELFKETLYKSISNSYEEPVERAITKLCYLIRFNRCIDDENNKRYEL